MNSLKRLFSGAYRLHPVRPEFVRTKPLDSLSLEAIQINADLKREPVDWHDQIAFRMVKGLRVLADAFFAKRYVHRAIILETVAAVPGMVAGMSRHLRSLRLMVKTFY